MRIVIGQRYQPFSHIPGETFLLPGSTFGFQIYPVFIKVFDLSSARPKLIAEHTLEIKGPASDFTIQQDLERGCITVWGHYPEGYLRYHIFPLDVGKDYGFHVEKTPSNALKLISSPIDYQTRYMSRLSLGSHRKQDWELIKRREDLTDILPLWLRLGQWTPQTPFGGWEGTLILLKKCQEAIKSKQKLILYDLFLNLFKGAFQGGLSPTLEDFLYQGYDVLSPKQGYLGSPLFLLTEGAKAIQNLFVSVQAKEISFLETLPPEFHCGRFVDVEGGDLGTFSMEWTKKTIRRIIFQSNSHNEVLFHFQHGIKRFRLRMNQKDRGQIVDVGVPLSLESKTSYFFDNFQK